MAREESRRVIDGPRGQAIILTMRTNDDNGNPVYSYQVRLGGRTVAAVSNGAEAVAVAKAITGAK